MTASAAQQTIQEAIRFGIRVFCICPGARNASLIAILKQIPEVKTFYFYDERSAAFFALGRSQAGYPAAILTTSGTAISHLLGAAMEAYYTHTPLLLITADRPRRFRNTNAPQSCEQKNIYGLYAKVSLDIEENEPCNLSGWDKNSPAHINICLEEPDPNNFEDAKIVFTKPNDETDDISFDYSELNQFFAKSKNPLAVIGSIKPEAREPLVQFLLQLNIPVYLEGISGLRENPRLEFLRITRQSKIWEKSEAAGYPIDGILRIGGIPTFRLWRDLEKMEGKVEVFSLNDVPFSGLSWGPIKRAPLEQFLRECPLKKNYPFKSSLNWLKEDQAYQEKLRHIFNEEPEAEPSLVHFLSKKIPKKSLVYLGNSLPIREWDLAATFEDRHYRMKATRGLNGIDGQTSVFFGLSEPYSSNWALLGDLTALHDLAAPWILPQLEGIKIDLAIINNGGGKIFEKMFPQKEIQNCHQIDFEPVAKLWNLSYERWENIPEKIGNGKNRLIEIRPNEASSRRFWEKLNRI